MSRVLIVEDDRDAAMAMGVGLRRRGHEVSVAPDAVSAIGMCRNYAPDVVLLDLGLPAGGGLEVLRRMRSLLDTAITPVLVVTGADVDESAMISAGAQGLLKKPFTPDELEAAVGTVMAKAV